MNKICALLSLILFWNFSGMGQATGESEKIGIIPQPVSVQLLNGSFELNGSTRVSYNTDSLKQVAALFSDEVEKGTGWRLANEKRIPTSSRNTIFLVVNKTRDNKIGTEGYHLRITSQQINISANSAHGVFYGLETLRQLLPSATGARGIIGNIKWKVPAVEILDYPKFGWRGMMLDVSRHWFTKDEVKQYIDQIAMFKYNVFHWHLTDDQGWRIEIKGLPELTKVGAFRVPRDGSFRHQEAIQSFEKATYGGYYTQDDIKEVIEYAKERFITVLPEIDVPGHSLALIAAYPNLSCTKRPYPIYPTYTPKNVDNDLCMANDSIWLVLDKIFTQVAELFPSEYIHVGGDEAGRKFWLEHAPDIALMKREGIKTAAELQSYFEKKLEKLIISKGKKMMGWDEILEGGIAPEAAVMSWTEPERGIEASQMGHHVVFSPYGKTYLSQLQGDPLVEPEGPAMTRLRDSYSTEILPGGTSSEWVLGGEAALWSEFVPNFRHAEYMTWPRGLATAEIFWGQKTDWENFVGRVESQLKRFDSRGIKYASSMYDPIISPVKNNDTLKVVLSTEIPGLEIYYTFDGTDPDKFFPRYEGRPLIIPVGANQIRVVTYRNGKPIGRQINCPVEVLEKRLKKSNE